ncbi:MAG: HNH endonuclease [Kiritimatiellales bacterium]|nr:HNH endonuclease [Kiritimatiellales bacterium]
MDRRPGTKGDGGSFDEETIEAVWQKRTPEPMYPPFGKDTCGTLIQRSKYGRTDALGWEIDHIKPVAEGGTDDLANLQPLHWINNRYKGDDWPDWSCKIKTDFGTPSAMERNTRETESA